MCDRAIWNITKSCIDLNFSVNFKTGILHIMGVNQMSRSIGKPTICIGENKGADQLRGNCKADQRLCFRYSDSAIPLLLKYEISSFYPASVTVQPD